MQRREARRIVERLDDVVIGDRRFAHVIAAVNDPMRDRIELRLDGAFVEPFQRAQRGFRVIRDGRGGVKVTVARGHLRMRVRTNFLKDTARDSLTQSAISADLKQLKFERRTAAVEYQYFHRHRGR